MTGMKSYYVSRAIISVAFGALFAAGSPWWTGILVGALAFAWFLLAPHIGRYSVHPEFGITALRRDERAQVINDKAARNAFVICMLVLGGMIIYFGTFAATSASIAVFKWLLILGVLIYYASDFWLRKALS
jgi:TRAP-type C4-dicarboxylate transport system permease large subunit